MRLNKVRSGIVPILALTAIGFGAYEMGLRGRSVASAAVPLTPALLPEEEGRQEAAPPDVPRAEGAPSGVPREEGALQNVGQAKDGPAALTVQLSDGERQAIGVRTTTVTTRTTPDEIRLSATTALDPDGLAHVHTRFGGEATEVRTSLGQKVRKGDILAVIWSKDLGEKKSEYIDARSQLKLNQEVLEKLETLFKTGAVPERSYRQAQRDAESSRIARDRAYRTLISWRLSKEEIAHIDKETDAQWPTELVRSPIDGTIVEKSLIPGEIVDSATNLMVVADLSKISIWAYAYEEDLMKVHPGDSWHVTLKACPGKTLTGTVRVVGAIVDPSQHTVTVQGTIPNPGEVLRAGMFATATMPVASEALHVVVPTSALVDEEDKTFVYVQSSRQPGHYQRRHVHVSDRSQVNSFIDEGLLPGESVVTAGALEIDQKAHAPAEMAAVP
jgi:cobalt-zinc-cadmium efflux system membrane fusion protein